MAESGPETGFPESVLFLRCHIRRRDRLAAVRPADASSGFCRPVLRGGSAVVASFLPLALCRLCAAAGKLIHFAQHYLVARAVLLRGSSWVTGAGAEGHSGGRARSGGCPGTGAAGWCGFGSGRAVRQGPAQEAPFQGQGRRPEANRERASCARTAGGNVFGAASGKEEAQAPSARRSAAQPRRAARLPAGRGWSCRRRRRANRQFQSCRSHGWRFHVCQFQAFQSAGRAGGGRSWRAERANRPGFCFCFGLRFCFRLRFGFWQPAAACPWRAPRFQGAERWCASRCVFRGLFRPALPSAAVFRFRHQKRGGPSCNGAGRPARRRGGRGRRAWPQAAARARCGARRAFRIRPSSCARGFGA